MVYDELLIQQLDGKLTTILASTGSIVDQAHQLAATRGTKVHLVFSGGQKRQFVPVYPISS